MEIIPLNSFIDNGGFYMGSFQDRLFQALKYGKTYKKYLPKFREELKKLNVWPLIGERIKSEE